MALRAEGWIADDKVEGAVEMAKLCERVAGNETRGRQKFLERGVEARVEFAAEEFAAGGRGTDEGTVAAGRGP
jgi:hypothetical protein